MEEKVIRISAVLHDIGILRSVKDEDVDHVSSSVDFINEMKMDKRINEIILHHHDSFCANFPVCRRSFFLFAVGTKRRKKIIRRCSEIFHNSCFAYFSSHNDVHRYCDKIYWRRLPLRRGSYPHFVAGQFVSRYFLQSFYLVQTYKPDLLRRNIICNRSNNNTCVKLLAYSFHRIFWFGMGSVFRIFCNDGAVLFYWPEAF